MAYDLSVVSVKSGHFFFAASEKYIYIRSQKIGYMVTDVKGSLQFIQCNTFC